MPRSFLLCGISWDEFDNIFPDPTKSAEMRAMIEGGLKKMEEMFAGAGLDYKFVNYSPNEDMSRWKELLAEKKWDAVAIGGGIRMYYPALATDLVNGFIEHGSGIKVFFNTTPDDTFAMAKRLFPEI